jgi:hypothetical protein
MNLAAGSLQDVGEARVEPVARGFREILLWPLLLEPLHAGHQIQRHWQLLREPAAAAVWCEVEDEFTGDPREFKQRHYSEFVTFLPHVQRFLYGEGAREAAMESPIRVFRRRDIARVRVTSRAGEPATELDIAHIDLYFFYDLDIAILALEVHGAELPLSRAQDLIYRLGRAYPPYWDSDGRAAMCPSRVEWLGAQGEVLAASDYERREKYLEFVCQHRAPHIASHWEYVLRPLVLHYSDEDGRLRYRQVEYHRMPVMAWLALDEPKSLTRADYVRLGLVSRPGAGERLPYSERYLEDFERRYCYDRYYEAHGTLNTVETRTLCSGESLVMVGCARDPFYINAEIGLLGQFRHQYFLLFLIAHMHKAALLMLSDRLVVAINRLDIHDVESVRRFKRVIRQTLEIFLRFTHRYWFHEVSIQVQARELFRMVSAHLGNEELYKEVREEVLDMEQYLDSDTFRRQANTVVRLTVVTIVGLIGTIVTGFLGMNLIAEAEASWAAKMTYFLVVFVPVVAIVLYSVAKSKRLSDFLETLSDERVSTRSKLRALFAVWERPPK